MGPLLGGGGGGRGERKNKRKRKNRATEREKIEEEIDKRNRFFCRWRQKEDTGRGDEKEETEGTVREGTEGVACVRVKSRVSKPFPTAPKVSDPPQAATEEAWIPLPHTTINSLRKKKSRRPYSYALKTLISRLLFIRNFDQFHSST